MTSLRATWNHQLRSRLNQGTASSKPRRRLSQAAAALIAFALASVVVAAPASAANLGTNLPLGHTMHTGDYIASGHWELVLDTGGNLIAIKTSTGQHCYAWGPAGANAFATFDGVSHHFYIKHSNGTLYKDFGSGGSGTNVSINNGNFYVGNTPIHGPGPTCSA